MILRLRFRGLRQAPLDSCRKHKHELSERCSEVNGPPCIVCGRQRGGVVSVVLILRVQPNIMGPLCHLWCDHVFLRGFIDPRIETSGCEVLCFKHRVDSAGGEHDRSGRCMLRVNRLPQVGSGSIRYGTVNGLRRRIALRDFHSKRRGTCQNDAAATDARVNAPLPLILIQVIDGLDVRPKVEGRLIRRAMGTALKLKVALIQRRHGNGGSIDHNSAG